jgi:hypothetical protein
MPPSVATAPASAAMLVSTASNLAAEGSEMSEILSEDSKMSSVDEASTLLRRVAGPRDAGDSVKVLIWRAARRLHWGPSRTKDVWYRNARRIDADEMDRLRNEAAKVKAEGLKSQLLEMRDGLAATNAEVHRPAIDTLERSLRELGCEVGTVGLRKD